MDEPVKVDRSAFVGRRSWFVSTSGSVGVRNGGRGRGGDADRPPSRLAGGRLGRAHGGSPRGQPTKAGRRHTGRTSSSAASPDSGFRGRRRAVRVPLALALILSGAGTCASALAGPAGATRVASEAAVRQAPSAGVLAGRPTPAVDPLVTTEWLAAHLDDPSIRIVDLRRGGAEDYARGHVPGAVNVANEALRDPEHPPTFLPTPPAFEALMGRLGISNETHVVAYDDRGGLYAARLWLVLNAFGHHKVSVLDGHFIKWQKEGRPVSTAPPTVAPARFAARLEPGWVATAEDVRAAIDRPTARIVDARTQAEREGRDLRGIRRGGIIPGSVGVYWEDTFDPEWKALKPVDVLAGLFRARDVRPEHEVIVYCQVGMRASHDALVLRRLGYERVRVYLGSWEEWGNRDDLPIATLQPGQR